MDARYTVSIYVAAPGTPLLSGGTSAAGHVYYDVSHGSERTSFGFAPMDHGVTRGPGKVYLSDADEYQKPFYKRTMEITREQFDKLREFGSDPKMHGFNMNYDGATNSCIDFTWGALNHAGLHRRNMLFLHDKDFEGSLKPLSNQEFIRTIRAPVPDSDLNKEENNRMPERTLLQRLISEQELPPKDRELLESIRTKVADVDQQHHRNYDDTSERISVGLLALAKENGMQRVEHVLLSKETVDAGPGKFMFIVDGDPGNPAHMRASMLTETAARTPVEQSYAKVGQLEQRHPERVLTASHDQQQATQESPVMRIG